MTDLIDPAMVSGAKTFLDMPFGHGTDISTGWVIAGIIAFFVIWWLLNDS